jgi:hypothetical protein
VPSWSLSVSTRWLFGATGLSVSTLDWSTGAETEELPQGAAVLGPRLSDWADLVNEHYTWVDDIDATRGWRDEDARRQFVVEADDLGHQLRRALGRGWQVHVSPQPGLTVVSLAGEYFSDWPLWVTGGGTGPESWPMLSPAMIERLTQWAELAVPDRYPGPAPDVTAELPGQIGPTFRVVA